MAKAKRKATAESAVRRDLRTPLYRMRVTKDRTKYNRKALKRVGAEGFRKGLITGSFRKLSALAAAALAVVAFSVPAHAISVRYYFSAQEQASIQNIGQQEAQKLLNGLHKGLYDGYASMILAGSGKIYSAGGPIVCVDSMANFPMRVFYEVLEASVGTYETPAKSMRALSEFPLGLHILKGLSERFPCNQDSSQ
jgi:hypothetical protein